MGRPFFSPDSILFVSPTKVQFPYNAITINHGSQLACQRADEECASRDSLDPLVMNPMETIWGTLCCSPVVQVERFTGIIRS